MNNLRIFKCSHCGNTIAMIEDMGAPVTCCGDRMGELSANSTDAASEKHVPVLSEAGNVIEVTVGSVAHPMTPEHSITWIILHTKSGFQIKYLDASGEPKAKFALSEEDALIAAYEYCNLHGLWKAAK